MKIMKIQKSETLNILAAKTLFLFCLIIFKVIPLFAETPMVRLKDVARIKGVRPNQLMGRGLVVGLNGSGDKIMLSAQMISNMLTAYGTRYNASELKTKNVAAVVITATLPPDAAPGDQIDVNIASLGDAKSLQGGTLLQAPLFGADNNVYAVAQGSLFIGQGGVPTSGYISDGAIVERDVPVNLVNNNKLSIILNKKDFTTANRVKMAVNEKFGQNRAKALDSGRIQVDLPISFRDNVVGFISSLEDLMIIPDEKARVVINESTGTVVMGQNVRISTIALSHASLNVAVGQNNERPGGVKEMESSATVGELVKALNSVGVTPKDLVAIMQALKKSGALHSDLVIM
jgi:flagellar P-ring protein precursor FlgI